MISKEKTKPNKPAGNGGHQKLNQNIKIMDKKELTDKIYSMRSYALIELACTIREIMKEHGILRKELKHPVLGYRENYEVTKIAIRDTYTALPVFAIRLVDVDKSERRVLATDNTWMDFDTLARIVSELNDELEG